VVSHLQAHINRARAALAGLSIAPCASMGASQPTHLGRLPVPSGRIVAFGVFEFDLETGELRSRGHNIRLQEQPCQVLRMLVARPGN
jgi:DNA-binding response OmpR family regulator